MTIYAERKALVSSPENRLWLTVTRDSQLAARRGCDKARAWFYSTQWKIVSSFLFTSAERAEIVRLAMLNDIRPTPRPKGHKEKWLTSRHENLAAKAAKKTEENRLYREKIKAKEVTSNVIQGFSAQQTNHDLPISEMHQQTGSSTNLGGWDAWRAAP